MYRLAVLQVEQHLLHFPTPPLLTLQQFLAEFQVGASSLLSRTRRAFVQREPAVLCFLRCGLP